MSDYNLVMSRADLREVVEHYRDVPAFVFDVETIGEHRGDPFRNRVTWLILATQGRTDVIPMGHPNGEYIRTDYPLLKRGLDKIAKGKADRVTEADYSKDERRGVRIFGQPPAQLDTGEVFAALRPVLFGDALKGGHNFGFDLQSVAKYYRGAIPTGPYFCTMWAAHVLDSRFANWLGLDDCLKREFGHTMVKGVGKDISKHSFEEVADYGAADGAWTWKLLKHYHARLKAEEGTKPFRLDMDVLAVTCNMELTGAQIDVSALKTLKVTLEKDLEDAKGRVFAAAGKAFPINSNPAKQQLLYGPKAEGGRALRCKMLTPAGKKVFKEGGKPEVKHYAVSAEALEPYRDVDPLATALLEYADLNKLMSTYVIPYLGGEVVRVTAGKEKKVEKASLMYQGRIHTRFAPLTETGRFSSRNPNLQNVPNASTDRGKAIRNLFTCGDDELLVVADYSQIEPRVTASFTQEKRLLHAYRNNEDVYTAIADPFGLPRKAGKVLFLALSYGVGPEKIAASIGIPLGKAKTLLGDFEDEFHAIYAYKARLVKEAKARRPTPYVTTLVGRRRYLPDLKSEYYGYKSRAERQAFNTKIQGSAADIMKIAMVRAHAMIPEQARMVLTVHDELVTVTPRHLADETADAITQAMEGVHALQVPLIADVKIVQKWGEAK